MKKHILLLLLFAQTIALAQQPVRDALLGTYTGRRINFIEGYIEEPVTVVVTAYPTDTSKIIFTDITNNLKDTARVVLEGNPTDTLLRDATSLLGEFKYNSFNYDYYDPAGSPDDPVWVYEVGNFYVGMDEKIKENLILFPNPTNDIITIQSEIIFQKFAIYNSLGQIIKLEKTGNSINIAELDNGLYVLIAETKAGPIIRRFIKE